MPTGRINPKLKLLHLYSGNVFGGIGSILTSLAQYAPEWTDIEQRFGLCFEARLSRELRDLSADVSHLGEARLRNRASLASVRRRLEESLQQSRPNLVICHDRWTICVFAPVLVRARIPFILWLHSFRGFNEDTLVTILSQLYRPAAILAVSHATLTAAKWLFPGVKKTVIYTPLPSALALFAKEAIHRGQTVSDTGLVILNAASLRPGKGQDRLLAALSLLKDNGRWVCWLAGDPRNDSEARYLAHLHSLVDKFDLTERVLFLGERSDMGELMRQADIYCHPNVFTEGFSIALLEASLAELPIVASPYGGNAEYFEGEDCGVLIHPEPGPLAEALRSLLSDPERRKRLGHNARQRAVSLCEVRRQMQTIQSFLTQTSARYC